MDHDIGLICQACGSVTIFQFDASHPRRCARCHDVEPPSAPSVRDTPTLPGTRGARGGRLQLDALDWLE